MAGAISRKRKVNDGMKGKTSRPVKKFKKQTDYHSSDSEDEPSQDFQAVNLQDSDDENFEDTEMIGGNASDGDNTLFSNGDGNESEITGSNSSDTEEDEHDSDTNSNPNLIRKRKRNDPQAFATSISKILSSKLTTSKRNDPVLARSKAAIEASREIIDQGLEKKVRHKLREDRRVALDKGRVKDVLGASTAFDAAKAVDENQPSVQEILVQEKRLRKTAQRGVVKLFNAVRAAQIKGEEAARESRTNGIVGQGRREEKINEMSKMGFLNLIAGGDSRGAGGVEIE